MAAEAAGGLDESLQSLLRVQVDKDIDSAKEAFASFLKQVNQAESHKEAAKKVLDDFPRKQDVLTWLVDLATASKILKRRVSSALCSLLKLDSWLASAQSDATLASNLAEVDDDVKTALGATPAVAAEPAAATGTTASTAFAAPAAAKVPTKPAPSPEKGSASDKPAPASGGYPPAGERAPETMQDFMPFADGSRKEEPDIARSDSKGQTSSATSAAILKREQEAERKADEETLEMLKGAFDRIAKLEYNVESKHLEAASDAVNSLNKAVNRMWFAHERQRSHVIAADASGEDTPTTTAQTLSFTQEDHFSSSLNEARAPTKVLLFLYHVQRLRSGYKHRCSDGAHKLTQLSKAFSEAARADAFICSWLGAVHSQADSEPVRTISYGLASRIHWAAWDLAWYAVHKQRGKDKMAADAKRTFEEAQKEVLNSLELPKKVLEDLMDAAMEACLHAAETRYPAKGQERGVLGNLMGAVGLMEDKGPHKDKFMKIFEELKANSAVTEQLVSDLMWMMWNLAWYAPNFTKGMGHSGDATKSLVKAARHLGACYRGDVKWRGVNLGGWFLLEPGPCTDFWTALPEEVRTKQKCEWGCVEGLGMEEAKRRLAEHRRKYFTKEEFTRMRQSGITHVRLPFGAWCIAGPRPGEQYVGPCLAELDQALVDLEAAGLMVILDLHGPVGGISEQAPTGHSNSGWRCSHWDEKASLDVLRQVAERYSKYHCVCGLEVANEPSESLSAHRLATYYEEAVKTIRHAGMAAGDVAVILPIFTERRQSDFISRWEQNYRKYEDIVFDVHLYQCFGLTWQGLSPDRHLKEAAKREKLLTDLPACMVGEWSLAISGTDKLSESQYEEFMKKFSAQQMEVYDRAATHGWFFWTWKDSAGTAWCMRNCLEKNLLTVPGA